MVTIHWHITHDVSVSVQVYMQYILVKSAVIEDITFKSRMLCDSSDTSHNVYLSEMFITLIACSVSQGYYLWAATIKTVAISL